ncbi:MAG: hypothetical protein QXD95_07545, partial [Nitrososphaeria archaeon]
MVLLKWWKGLKKTKQVNRQIMMSSTQTRRKFKPIELLKPINSVEIKANELFSFIELAIKYATREIIGVGIGIYDSENKSAKITSIYAVLDAPGNKSRVMLDVATHQRLDETLNFWRNGEEIAVLHSHPGFGCLSSAIDEAHGIRMAALLFGGIAVMIIVDPLHIEGIKIAAFSLDPANKAVRK